MKWGEVFKIVLRGPLPQRVLYRRGVRVAGFTGIAYPFGCLRVVMFQRGFMKLHVVASQDMALMISKRDAHYPYSKFSMGCTSPARLKSSMLLRAK